ncbi:MAG: aminoglycoside phosphotransferase family protein [Verrucomicrobiaceae bacterium]
MSRRDIYYWKCDRPAAFHGTQLRIEADANIAQQLEEALREHFGTTRVALSPGAGQGNHLTWNADVDDQAMFVRVENGSENDGHLAVESELLDRVRAAGVLTPRVFGCDATRCRVSFAWQALERIAASDLNHWFKQRTLDVPHIAFDIGVAMAKWQSITPEGFGILEWSAQSSVRRDEGVETSAPHRGLCGPLLSGTRRSYADYFHLRFDEHLAFLVSRGFLGHEQLDEIAAEIDNHQALLRLERGCLVHKDLALWNILGSKRQITAFIDFDDAISGDPMDDLSLLACFHDAAFLRRAFEGYQSIRPLPEHHLRRFWLHLLRNMIVKAVIRVGAGYFERDSGFFLIGSGSSGANLREFTLARLALALRGLREGCGLDILQP